MQKLANDASEQEWCDFTMAMTRKVFDSFKWEYWVFCDNRSIRMDYWGLVVPVSILPGEVSIQCSWDCANDISEKFDKLIADSKYVRYEKKLVEQELYDEDKDDGVSTIIYKWYTFTFIGELPLENRVDSEYFNSFKEDLVNMMEEITDYFGYINDDRIAMSGAE